jgi:DNA-binding transcriptional LysR family regulator
MRPCLELYHRRVFPSLESLRCFLAGARLLNFRAASRAVALTPAAFGARIKQLEDELGVPLFQRTTRTVYLTTAGLALVPAVMKCLDAAEDCARAARGEIDPPPFDLTVGTRQELGLSWLTPQLDALSEKIVGMQIHLYFGSGPDLLLRVRTHEIDCAITSSRFSDPKLDSFRLHREDYVFVGATELLRQTPLRRADDARHHTLLDERAELPLFGYWRDAPGGGDRLSFARIVRLGSIEAIRQRLLAGAGVAVIPRYLVKQDLAKRRLKLVFPSIEPQHDYFRLVFRADDPRRALFAPLADALLTFPLR